MSYSAPRDLSSVSILLFIMKDISAQEDQGFLVNICYQKPSPKKGKSWPHK